MGQAATVVTGGLGYIGQSLAAYLKERGHHVVVMDRRHVTPTVDVPVIHGDIAEASTWDQLEPCSLRAVFHCAGLIQVAESTSHPARYFQENVAKGIAMLGHIRNRGPAPIIFSSSAAVYGTPEGVPISESAVLAPMSPYGITKRQFEEVLAAYSAAYDLPYMALRYFNAAGRYGGIVESHQPETHLLPLILQCARRGEAPVIFGHDYPTADGTAVRDFVHIRDLAAAHLRALEYLEAGLASTAVNLGSGDGVSVLAAVRALAAVFGPMREPEYRERRAGDPPVLVADISRAKKLLEWEPRHSAIEAIVEELVREDRAQ